MSDNSNKMYIVSESYGMNFDYYTKPLFVTRDKDRAYEYKRKYNTLLTKLKEFYQIKSKETLHLLTECEEAGEWLYRYSHVSDIHSVKVDTVEVR